MSSEIVWEDKFGEVIDRAEEGFVEIRWYDTTAGMTSDEFNQWLAGFATTVEERRRPGVLVDSLAFQMDMALMDGAIDV